jgi:NADH-quinone oxidoreductase subunit A
VLEEARDGTGAAAGSGIGFFALVEGVVFIAILFLGLAYVWAKGDLDWILHYEGGRYQPSEPVAKRRIPTIDELESEAASRAAAAPKEAAQSEKEESEKEAEEVAA